MSVLIKGMEMPKDGCHHMICIYADGTVSTGGRVYMAVPVPLHGRLIDADALEENAQKRLLMCSKNDNQFQKPYEVMREIALAPTIIPASEEVYDKYTDTAGNLHWTGTHSGKHIVKAEEGER